MFEAFSGARQFDTFSVDTFDTFSVDCFDTLSGIDTFSDATHSFLLSRYLLRAVYFTHIGSRNSIRTGKRRST